MSLTHKIHPERYLTVPLFLGLEPREIISLLKISEDLVVAEGEEIVREGDQGDGFYVIAKGAFEVRKGQSKEILARLEELSFFGEMALVTQSPRSASVVCVEQGRLKKFAMDKFNRMLMAGDIVAYKVIRNMSRILAERLERAQARLTPGS
jgi:CRP/FNR family transcriptional regulator, cyclic AMP receptor protein